MMFLKGTLTGAFMMVALPAASQVIFENPWLYFRRPVIPLPPPVLVIPPNDAVMPDFDLENCIVGAMEGQRSEHRMNAPPVRPKQIPDKLDPSITARTVYMDRVQTQGFLNGAMVIVDHQQDGTGSLSISAFYLHETNTDLDHDKPEPAGQGTITRLRIAKEDVGPPGPRDTFSGPQAKPATIKLVRERVSGIADGLRICMGSGPYVPGTNKFKPQLKGPGFY